MSTYYSTYNFNQGNMNFGQALMYGAFGSLTGGMGCGFGGYGMGMGGSLFSMMGMGGFGGYGMGYGMGFGMSDNQYVGTLAGLMGSQILIGGISQAIQNHRTAKAEAQEKIDTAKSDLQTVNKEIDTLTKEQSDLVVPTKGDKASDALVKLCSTEAKAYNLSITSYENISKRTEDYYKNDPDIKPLLEADPKDQTAINNKVAEKNTAAQKAFYDGELEEKYNALKTAIETKKNENDEKLKELNSKKADAQKVVDDNNAAIQTKNNNKNAKIEAKCDSEEIDDTVVQGQTNTRSTFNQAYEKFKKAQTKDNFTELKNAYNSITGNKKSFTQLMKAIIKQHPDFDQSGINWG